jgi:hypothetical protein
LQVRDYDFNLGYCYDPSQFLQEGINNMKLTKNLGMLLLGIWLIVTGLLHVVSIPIPAIGTVLALLAIAAGVSLLLGR